MLWKGLGQNHPMAAHILESKGLDYMFANADCKEGVTSFFEKRKPRFKMNPARICRITTPGGRSILFNLKTELAGHFMPGQRCF